MARSSKWESFKPRVLELFEQGKAPSEVSKLFQQVPVGTIYGWYKAFKQKASIESSHANREASVIPDIKLEEDLSDLDFARKVFRHLAKLAPSEGVRIQASYGLVKATEMKLRSQKTMSRELFLYMTRQMWLIVQQYVDDPEILHKIRDDWRAIETPEGL